MEHLLYMSVYMGNDPGLFRSNDEGESWTYITSAEMTRTAEALAVYGGTLYASSGSVEFTVRMIRAILGQQSMMV